MTDRSGGGHTAEVRGATWTSDGVTSGALRFQGRDNYIRVRDLPLTDNTQIGLCLWIKNPPTTCNIIAKWPRTGLSPGSYLFSVSNGRVGFHLFLNGASTPLTGRSLVPNDGQWHHIAGTYDGSEMRVYLDGVLDGSMAAEGDIDRIDSDVWLGRLVDGSYPFTGSMDEVRIYERSLSEDEVKQIYRCHKKTD